MSLRRVMPQLEDYGDGDEVMSSAPSEEGEGEGEGDESDHGSDMDEDGVGEEREEEETPQEEISKISFGALAKAQKAQKAVSKVRLTAESREARTASTKPQLSTLKDVNVIPPNSASSEKKARKTREELKRSSKHAPQEISSKRAVTRRREVVTPLFPSAQLPRDPRFDDAVKGVFDERVFKKNYEFLEGYKEDELKMLESEMAKTKDERKKQQLNKLIISMQSKKQQQKRKERTEQLVRDHKKKERDLIKQGKKPFYLKKAEQKKMLLMDRYSKLNEKQLNKVVEKKRKRKAQKEHKNIPFARREA